MLDIDYQEYVLERIVCFSVFTFICDATASFSTASAVRPLENQDIFTLSEEFPELCRDLSNFVFSREQIMDSSTATYYVAMVS